MRQNFSSAEELGLILRDLRKAKGMTQAELAAACGTGSRFVGDLERGKGTCELEKAIAVATLLGVKLKAESR